MQELSFVVVSIGIPLDSLPMPLVFMPLPVVEALEHVLRFLSEEDLPLTVLHVVEERALIDVTFWGLKLALSLLLA